MPESFSHTKELTAILRAAPEDAFPVAVYGYRSSTDRTVAVAALSMPRAQRFLEKFALTVDMETLARACFGYHVSESDVAQPVAKVMTLQTQRDVELLGCREAQAPLSATFAHRHVVGIWYGSRCARSNSAHASDPAALEPFDR
jgi:hypothetical protein